MTDPSNTARAAAQACAADTACAACGARFGCGVALPGCWCTTRPPLAAPGANGLKGCLCPTCLDAALTSERQAGDRGAPGEAEKSAPAAGEGASGEMRRPRP